MITYIMKFHNKQLINNAYIVQREYSKVAFEFKNKTNRLSEQKSHYFFNIAKQLNVRLLSFNFLNSKLNIKFLSLSITQLHFPFRVKWELPIYGSK